MGVLLTAVGIGLSWPSAWFFHEPALQPVAMALSLNFVVGSLSAAQTAMAQRELRFRELALRDISASLIGGGVGITLAAMGFGVWSLVAQSLVSSFASAVLIWPLSAWRPRISQYSGALLREMWPYSSQLFLFNVFKSFVQNLDRILLGHFLGSTAVGLYVFAYRLVVQPISTLVGAVGTYLFPFLSRLQEDRDAMRRAYGDAMRWLAVIALPAAVLCALAAPSIVPLIWGERWVAAVPLIQVMGLLAVFQAYMSPVGQLLKSLDRPRWLLWWSVGITATVAVLLWAGVQRGGVGGAVWGITIAYALGVARDHAHDLGADRIRRGASSGARVEWRSWPRSSCSRPDTPSAGCRSSLRGAGPRSSCCFRSPRTARLLAWLDQSLLGGGSRGCARSRPSGAPPMIREARP